MRGGIRLRRARIGGDFVARQAAIISRRYAQAACLESRGQCQLCLKKLREKLINDELNTLKINDKSGWKQVNGIFFIDPHGDAIDKLLEYLSPLHLQDTILLDPEDPHYSFGINLLECHNIADIKA